MASDCIYVGDGVYVGMESGMFKVWTWDGQRETNVIFLEPEVFVDLAQYCEARLNRKG